MENLVSGDRFSTVRSIVGTDHSDMDIIRALHLANNDATAAINIIFDTPNFGKRLSKKNHGASCIFSSSTQDEHHEIEGMEDCYNHSSVSVPDLGCRTMEGGEDTVYSDKNGSEWWLLGRGDIPGLSTCKGRKVKIGDEVDFIFPQQKECSPPPGRVFGRGRRLAICSDIVRFSTKDNGEIGRIPKEWARCLLPLVRDQKVRIEGTCKYAPQLLSIMDTVVLAVRVYLYSPTFLKRHQVSSLKFVNHSNEESTFHPLPFLFNLLGITPFIKAEFTPFNLFTRKRPLDLNDNIDPPSSVGDIICKMQHGIIDKSEDGETISDNDLDFIVGTADSSDLQEMDPPDGLVCDLRPYQKQALFWMTQLEQGRSLDDPSKTLHPCWSAYHLADRKRLLYLNSFSGDATTEFPSTLEMARGGVLADAMGLGKTIMTIALLLSRTGKGGSSSNKPISELSVECTDVLSKLIKQKTSFASGGTLIVCPMTLLGQWKAEIEAHTECGSLSAYIHYGQSRSKDTQSLAQNDVVITTYGVLASEFSAESTDSGGLGGIHWFRVVLDEAHVIKSSKSQISLAAAALIADCRWCLTGTPIQNNLEDIYSLLRFLKVEPWGNWAWWNKLVQKPFDEGDDRGLKLVQSILKPIMLRRTKSTTDRNGRPIVVLPPAEIKVVYCQQTEAEKDFYESLFKRSKVKFDQFVEQGRVLHNYASILELLLRLRQCCDHPFLVMSRGDTQDFTDLNKLAKKFLKGNEGRSVKGGNDVPSRAYVKEVVDGLRKGEEGECPICLEAFEDAVLTPCAHRMCRECLLGSLRNLSSGFCPVCRKSINRQDLITAPTGSRFQIDVESNWIESSKVSVLLSELESLRSSGSKSIVFSQWTAFLDLLQIPLSRNSISFLRLDGTLSQQNREKVIKRFSEEAGIMVLLMSLKAGGVGINLTAASNAFVLDPWWNPAVEEQAVMRVHRIGQTKPVMIKRFIVKGTVEERMEMVQARKQRMISGALTDEEVRTTRIEELKMLFT